MLEVFRPLQGLEKSFGFLCCQNSTCVYHPEVYGYAQKKAKSKSRTHALHSDAKTELMKAFQHHISQETGVPGNLKRTNWKTLEKVKENSQLHYIEKRLG